MPGYTGIHNLNELLPQPFETLIVTTTLTAVPAIQVRLSALHYMPPSG